jgi:hypothetical protein
LLLQPTTGNNRYSGSVFVMISRPEAALYTVVPTEKMIIEYHSKVVVDSRKGFCHRLFISKCSCEMR